MVTPDCPGCFPTMGWRGFKKMYFHDHTAEAFPIFYPHVFSGQVTGATTTITWDIFLRQSLASAYDGWLWRGKTADDWAAFNPISVSSNQSPWLTMTVPPNHAFVYHQTKLVIRRLIDKQLFRLLSFFVSAACLALPWRHFRKLLRRHEISWLLVKADVLPPFDPITLQLWKLDCPLDAEQTMVLGTISETRLWPGNFHYWYLSIESPPSSCSVSHITDAKFCSQST